MTKPSAKISVLFVCMGNICRSPTAEGVFRKFVSDAGLDDIIHSDSAGTHAYHSGQKADRRARAAAERRGYSLEDIRARPVTDMDFEGFDFILAMDLDNLDFSTSAKGGEVPDPYYGGSTGFERVLDLVEEASEGLLDRVRESI